MNRDIIYKYLQYWYLFLASILFFSICAFAYLRYATPEYQIDSSLLIKSDKSAVLEGSAFNNKSEGNQLPKNIDDEIEFFTSNNLMQRVMEDLFMQVGYFVKGSVKTTEMYGKELPIKVVVEKIDYAKVDSLKMISIIILDRNKYNLKEGNKVTTYRYGQMVNRPSVSFRVGLTSTFHLPFDPIIIKVNNLEKLSKGYVSNRLQVSPKSKTSNVLAISLTDPIPQRGIDIVDKLIDIYNQEGREDKNKIASNTLQFIDVRLKYLTNELSGVEKNVEQYKQQNKVTDVASNAQLYFQNAGEYNKQLSEIDSRINVLSSVERYFTKPGNQEELVGSTLGIADPTLSDLILKFNNLQLERQQNLRTVQPGNPIIIRLDEQIATYKANIQENLRNIKNSLIIARNGLRASSSKFESKIQSVPSIEKDLLQIKRQQGIKESLYLYLLQKREESALSLAATVSNSRIVDQAFANDKPVKPKRQLIYLFVLFFGVGFPFLYIYVKDLLNDKVLDMTDIKLLTKVDILGEISHNNTGESIVVKTGNSSTISELFRLVRANLKFNLPSQANKVLLVTSNNSGEGKTFFSINLGISLALTNKKVVLLEFDLRKPELLKNINMNSEMGISNYLSNTVELVDIVKPSNIVSNLFVVSAGSVPADTSEILLSTKLETFFEFLRGNFDYIILDTSPIGQVSDAYSLAPYIDAGIFIVRYNYTLKSQLSLINNIADKKIFKNPLLVLNDAKTTKSIGYAYTHNK